MSGRYGRATHGPQTASAPGSGRDSWLELLQGRGSPAEGVGDDLVPVQDGAAGMQLAGALLAESHSRTGGDQLPWR